MPVMSPARVLGRSRSTTWQQLVIVSQRQTYRCRRSRYLTCNRPTSVGTEWTRLDSGFSLNRSWQGDRRTTRCRWREQVLQSVETVKTVGFDRGISPVWTLAVVVVSKEVFPSFTVKGFAYNKLLKVSDPLTKLTFEITFSSTSTMFYFHLKSFWHTLEIATFLIII